MVIKNCQIVLENKIIENGWIEIKVNKITDIGVGKTLKVGIDLKNKIVIPGFIDSHVHGGYGIDFIEPHQKNWDKFAQNCFKEGITSFCPTLVTASKAKLDELMVFTNKYLKIKQSHQAQVIGIHLEGPFINPKYLGAHDLNLVVKPNINWVQEWNHLSNNSIKIISYAIEKQDGSFTKFLKNHHIIANVGHSDATFEQVKTEVGQGLSQFCHLHNAMSKYDHRHPGVLPAGLYYNLPVEIIADGIHIDPNIIRLTYKIKGASEIILITDAMAAKAMTDGNYKIGNLEATKIGDRVVLKDTNILAGSVAKYDQCFRNIINWTNCSLTEAIKMSSINIAKQLNIFANVGSIAINKVANLVVLDDDYQIVMTICQGNIVYQREEK